MTRRLTKAELQEVARQVREGQRGTTDVDVPEWDATVTLRPLSVGEAARVKALEMSGVTITGDREHGETGVAVDLEAAAAGAERAEQTALACAMSHGGEQWTAEEVAELSPAGPVERLAKEVYRISGIADPREQRKRALAEARRQPATGDEEEQPSAAATFRADG